MIVAGIDEAGYGPLLGPLVVSVAVFRVPGAGPESVAREELDLWTALAPAVTKRPDGHAVPVDDSKKLFQQRKGLRHLEEGLLPFLFVADGNIPRDFRGLLQRVARRGRGGAEAYLDRYPWYCNRTIPIPQDTFPGVLKRLADRLGRRLAETGIEFVGLAAVPMEVRELNQGFEQSGNKADVSFSAVGAFLRRLWRRFAEEEIDVVVDRQGGRTRYGARLFEKVRPRAITIDSQGPEGSRYRLLRRGRKAASMRVSFAAGSEGRAFPVALASMLSKYLRELHMVMFNQFWQAKDRRLRPTAGYTVDARRFLADTSELRAALGIHDDLLVRTR